MPECSKRMDAFGAAKGFAKSRCGAIHSGFSIRATYALSFVLLGPFAHTNLLNRRFFSR